MTKYSEKISEKDVENLIDNVTTPKEVAEKNNVPVSAVNNKKERTIQKKKLKVGFTSAKVDQGVSETNFADKDFSGQSQKSPDQIPIDARPALKGMWSMADMIFSLLPYLSKGQVEYTKLEDKDLEELAEVCNGNETMRKIATMQGVDWFVIIGLAGSKFVPRIKINKTMKHDEKLAKEFKCKCQDCQDKIKKMMKEKEVLQKVTEGQIKDSISEVKAPESEKEKELREFIQRNTGSNPKDLAAADRYLESKKNPDGSYRTS